jgi:hypothetical protein
MAAEAILTVTGWVENKLKVRGVIVFCALVSFLAAGGIARSLRFISWQPKQKEVASWIKKNYPDYKVCSTNATVYGFYLGYNSLTMAQKVDKGAISLNASSGKWLFVDDTHSFSMAHLNPDVGALSHSANGVMAAIRGSYEPVLKVKNGYNFDYFVTSAMAANIKFKNSMKFLKEVDVDKDSLITVYKLSPG